MRLCSLLSVILLTTASAVAQQVSEKLPALTEISVVSSIDGHAQPVLYWAPPNADSEPPPLFVFLHSWSSDYRQQNTKWQRLAVEHGWFYLHPNFRGINQSPEACGSRLARQDILDAMDAVRRRFSIDESRIYLCGVSGGGHMSMLMAGHHPDRFTAVSAWVGISDLSDWYRFHVKDGEPQKYARMILKCFGDPPGTSDAVDADYRDRSPLHHLHQVGDLPIEIIAGVNDGHTGSVPVSQSLRAFNVIAASHGDDGVSEAEMRQLWENRKLTSPSPSDLIQDDALGREIYLRRTSGSARVTIFEGGHESIPAAAADWLTRYQRKASASE